jgi:hypothetical protein
MLSAIGFGARFRKWSSCLPALALIFGLSLPSHMASVAQAAPAAIKKSAAPAASRQVTRSREDMILEVEMKALREALDSRQDQEGSSKFADKADKEYQDAKTDADKARTMLQSANATQSEVTAAKDAAVALVEKAKAAADEVQTIADKAKTDAKLAGVDVTTFTELRALSKKEVTDAEGREVAAQSVLDQAREKEDYYRALVKRRMRNAEDFYYIADAAMKKGGNAQALEFAVKAKAEMEQAKIAENEAAIRAEATHAAEKVVDARKQATEAAKIKSTALAQLLRLTEEITKTLSEAYASAALSSKAAQQYLAKLKDFASSKDEVLAFSSKKVESLTNIKDSSEKKETLTGEAAQAAREVLAAKQKAQADSEARAQSALSDARTVVLGPQQQVPVSSNSSSTVQ